jgi:threonyl-tRNA synthetase
MLNITFPDGSVKQFQKESSGEDIAKSISISLLKKSLAIEFNGKQQDLYLPITTDGTIKIITTDSEDGLEIIRHDTAHILAQAIKELYPLAQITIGPVIEDGFYYDVAYDQHFTPEDLVKLENKMTEIVKRGDKIRREVWKRDDAVKYFNDIGEKYKAEIISDLPEKEEISLYRQGDFLDLCRGPHAPTTSAPKSFKLTKLAGAYWRGDSKNPMLQRIYGTAWANKEDLAAYLFRIEEAEKRDHRKIGREIDLFHMQEEATGMVFWHPKGWTIFKILQNYIREKYIEHGYSEVKTPILVDRSLWEASGHWEMYGHIMFTSEVEEKHLAVKPMNCPCHVQIFKQGLKSYRELPLRMAEFGTCHRNEPSGSLHGIMRVREFVQDDAHIFCMEDQIAEETIKFCDFLSQTYKDFGFEDFKIKFADRPDVRAGSNDVWDKAENALKTAIETTGHSYTINKGEGAFYGPKLEFVLRDAIGRDWQCGTLQVDFVMPERLDASYIGQDGNKHRPVMLHRAIFGSLERFVGILIEHYVGKFPLWLAPIQVVILTITNDIDEYGYKVLNELKKSGIRAEIDSSNEKINYKIRKHLLQKIPVLFILGHKEQENNTITLRRTSEDKQETLELYEAIAKLDAEVKNHN